MEWTVKVSTVTVALDNEVTILTNKKLTETIEGKRVTQKPSFRYCEPVAYRSTCT